MTATDIVAVWHCARCGWRGTWRGSDPKAPEGGETTVPTATDAVVQRDDGPQHVGRVLRMNRAMPDRCPDCGGQARFADSWVAPSKAGDIRRRGNARKEGANGR